MRYNDVWRIRVLWVGMLIIVIGFVGRLYWLQIIEHDTYTRQADRQYASSGADEFNRGSIFFSDKEGKLISAASLASGFLLSINPSLIVDPKSAYEELSKIISGIDKTEFLTKAGKKSDTYEEIAHKLNTIQAAAVRKLNAKWTILSKEQWRFYSGSRLASHVLGLVGYQGDLLAAVRRLTGVEKGS